MIQNIEQPCQIITNLSNQLTSILQKVDKNYTHQQQIFQSVMSTISWIRSETKKIKSLGSIKEGILIIGNTGNGKSTLLNYLIGEQLFVNQQRCLYSKNRNVVIGKGNGSTTLLPNIVQSQLGTFLDLAGDFETRGLIADLFNSLWKSKLQLDKSKIILVVPQSSFGASGSYGKNFKQMMEKNSKFLENINQFKENAVMVLTFASRSTKGFSNAITNLKRSMEHTDQILKPYKQFINHLIENNQILPFALPDQDSEQGSQYIEPGHDSNQKINIENAIRRCLFKEKSVRFQVSSNPKQREILLKLLRILTEGIKSKVQGFIRKRRTIHGIQIKKAHQILQKIKDNCQFNLQHDEKWVQKLNHLMEQNRLFQYQPLLAGSQVTQNIACVIQFLKTSQIGHAKNVKLLSQTSCQAITQIINQLNQVMLREGQNFRKISQNVRPVYNQFSYFEQKLKCLRDCYSQLQILSQERNNSDSQFYFNQAYNQHIRTDIEQFTEQQPYQHPITKYKTISFIDKQPYTDYYYETVVVPYEVDEQYDIPVTKNRTAYRQEMEAYTVKHKKRVFGICVGVDRDVAYRPKTVSYQESYVENQKRTRKVTKFRNDNVSKPVTRYRDVPKTRQQPYETTQTRYRPVQKTRQVPVFEQRTRRVLNQQTYNQCLSAKVNQKEQIIADLEEKLNPIVTRECIDYIPEQFTGEQSGLPQEYKDLIAKWEKGEVVYYGDKWMENNLL